MTDEPTSPRRVRQQVKTQRVLFACVALLAVGNVLFASLFLSGSPPGYMRLALVRAEIGSVSAQLGLHAIWCVLASAGLWKRLAWGAAAGLIWLAAWVAGLLLEDAESCYLLRGVLPTVLLCLPLAVIASQAPLWIVRGFLRWRIVHRRDPARRLPAEPMGIRHLLIATAVVAAAISAARMGLKLDGASPSSALVELVLFALVVAGLSSLTVLPALAATLRAWRVPRALLTILAFYVIVALALAVLRVLERGTTSLQQSAEDLTVLAGLFVCLTGPLLLLRRLGYRLYWRRR